MSKQNIILATSNKGKIRELEDLCSDWPVNISTLAHPIDVVEDGLSFVENALIKARAYAQASGHPALADDSGLVIDSLDGAPGIYSARYAGPYCTSKENIQCVLDKLADKPHPWSARFVCVLALVDHPNDPDPWLVRASWEGKISPEPIGLMNFGYDPIFIPKHHQHTAAELMPEIKNRYSHRFQAHRKMTKLLTESGYFINNID